MIQGGETSGPEDFAGLRGLEVPGGHTGKPGRRGWTGTALQKRFGDRTPSERKVTTTAPALRSLPAPLRRVEKGPDARAPARGVGGPAALRGLCAGPAALATVLNAALSVEGGGGAGTRGGGGAPWGSPREGGGQGGARRPWTPAGLRSHETRGRPAQAERTQPPGQASPGEAKVILPDPSLLPTPG